jgi:hypothetical protein
MDFEPFFSTVKILGLALSQFITSFSKSRPFWYVMKPDGLTSTLFTTLNTLNQRKYWQTGKALGVRWMLQEACWARSSDPRDKVYALTRLIHPKYTIVPDYTQTTASGYCSTCWSIINAERSLDILTDCYHPREKSEIVRVGAIAHRTP